MLRRLSLSLMKWDGDLQGRFGKIIRRSAVTGAQKKSIRKNFGVQLHMSVTEAYAIDKLQGNTHCADSIKKELDSIMNWNTLHFPANKAEKAAMEETIRGNDG